MTQTCLLLPPCCLITGFQSSSAVEIVTVNSLECQCDMGTANGKGDQGNQPFPWTSKWDLNIIWPLPNEHLKLSLVTYTVSHIGHLSTSSKGYQSSQCVLPPSRGERTELLNPSECGTSLLSRFNQRSLLSFLFQSVCLERSCKTSLCQC